jgi:uncharacterized membrane protein YgdD (TMEM256/DUF423 family)
LALLAVGAGAFGAHVLEGRISGDSLKIFDTAVQYQVYHAFGLLAVAVFSMSHATPLLQWAGKLFVAGTVVFSGSLYLLAFTGIGWLGAITPIGGVCFLLGWGAMLWSFVSQSKMTAVQSGT